MVRKKIFLSKIAKIFCFVANPWQEKIIDINTLIILANQLNQISRETKKAKISLKILIKIFFWEQIS